MGGLGREPREEEKSCDEVGEDELMERLLVFVSLLYSGVAGL